MDDTTKIIRDFYDAAVEQEWRRIAGRPEFLLTCRMLDRYIRPGDRVLDIGGGPGRYSLYLAEKDCDLTLLDLSPANTKSAAERAVEQGLALKTVTGDARVADTLVDGQFDHVLLMGPMYHLQIEADRVRAVEAALKVLKPGGVLFVSFISSIGGIVYMMKFAPEALASTPMEVEFMNCVLDDKPITALTFTEAYFERCANILPFFERFPLQKLHLFGQEGILSPCEGNIMSQSEIVKERWLDLAEKLMEREEFLSWAEHLMYVGRKI